MDEILHSETMVETMPFIGIYVGESNSSRAGPQYHLPSVFLRVSDERLGGDREIVWAP